MWGIAAICVAKVAGSRNRKAVGWFCYGLLCWPFALSHVLILPPLSPPKPVSKPQGEHADDDMAIFCEWRGSSFPSQII